MPLELQAVTLRYQPGTVFEKTALNQLSLKVEEGEFLAITGGEGSGKSTLLLVMTGLMKPTQGQVLYKHRPLPRRGLHPDLGLVLQHPEQQIFELTVFEEVSFGPRNQGLSGDRLRSAVREGLEAVGLDLEKYGRRSTRQLSTGEKRRLAMAGILALNPRVLLLDEPLAGLDHAGRCALVDHLSRLNRDKGTTVIMVTHQLRPVYGCCSRVVQMANGEIAASLNTKPADLARPPGLFKAGDLPLHVQLLSRLQEGGWPVPFSTPTPEEAAQAMLVGLKRREGDHE